MTYIALINLLGLIVMFLDKKSAQVGAYRISEKTLFTVALLGGSGGIWAGMYLFRHKTRQPRFILGIPAILAIQIGLILFL